MRWRGVPMAQTKTYGVYWVLAAPQVLMDQPYQTPKNENQDPKQDPKVEPDDVLRRMLNTPPKPHKQKGKSETAKAMPDQTD